MCVWRSAGFSVPSGLSLARAVSPLVTWELLVWISVCLTGYKQGTALDSQTPASSAHSTAELDTHNFPLSLYCVCVCVCVLLSVPLCITSPRPQHTTAPLPIQREHTPTGEQAQLSSLPLLSLPLFPVLLFPACLFSFYSYLRSLCSIVSHLHIYFSPLSLLLLSLSLSLSLCEPFLLLHSLIPLCCILLR